jgi:hypothetical protein
MTQNRDSGAEAAKFGHKAAGLIAEKIGAKKLTSKSNEFDLKGNRVTIRTAHQGNNQVGVLYSMLGRVQSVIAAFEIAPNEYELLFAFPLARKVSRSNARLQNGKRPRWPGSEEGVHRKRHRCCHR